MATFVVLQTSKMKGMIQNGHFALDMTLTLIRGAVNMIILFNVPLYHVKIMIIHLQPPPRPLQQLLQQPLVRIIYCTM